MHTPSKVPGRGIASRKLSSVIDRAVPGTVLHRFNVSRKKSRKKILFRLVFLHEWV